MRWTTKKMVTVVLAVGMAGVGCKSKGKDSGKAEPGAPQAQQAEQQAKEEANKIQEQEDKARQANEEAKARQAEEAAKAGRAFSPVGVGIGINSGPCSVGNMGSQQRFAYSGDTEWVEALGPATTFTTVINQRYLGDTKFVSNATSAAERTNESAT